MTIHCHHNLPIVCQEFIERGDEFALGCFFGCQEVQVVEKQGRAFAELVAERPHLAALRGLDETRREFLGRYIDRPLIALTPQAGINPFEQMCFAGPHRSVNNQWVHFLARRFDDAQGGSMSKPIARTDNELRQQLPSSPGSGGGQRFIEFILFRNCSFSFRLGGWEWVAEEIAFRIKHILLAAWQILSSCCGFPWFVAWLISPYFCLLTIDCRFIHDPVDSNLWPKNLGYRLADSSTVFFLVMVTGMLSADCND